MWGMVPNAEYLKKVAKWPKKHRRELAAMLANLQIVVDALSNDAKVEHLRFGFMHSEPSGVLAVDQKGGGVGLKESRLYLYPDKESETLHLITLGDKSSQPTDIIYCKSFVADLRR